MARSAIAYISHAWQGRAEQARARSIATGYVEMPNKLSSAEAKSRTANPSTQAIIFLGSSLVLAVLAVATNIAVLLLVPLWYLLRISKDKNSKFNRTKLFESDYVAFLTSLAASVKTGLDPFSAFLESSRLFPADSVLANELRQSNDLANAGSEEDEVIRQFAKNLDHPDLDLFRHSFILSRRQGSSLGSCLQRLARTTRQRQSFRRKIRAATAMQRLSAFGIVGCTLVIATIQIVSSPEAVRTAVSDPVGIKLLLLGMSLVSCGLAWILSLTRARI